MSTLLARVRREAKCIAKDIESLLFLPKLWTDKQDLDKLQTLPELLSVLCKFRGRGTILANQEPSELETLTEYVLSKPPRVVVEIGTAKGGTLYLWSRIAAAGALLVSIDKPGEVGSVGTAILTVYRTFGKERGVRVLPIAGDSHSEDAHKKLRDILDGRAIDFLFIDGDHSYQGVKADFYGYQGYMAPGALIALHDVAVPPIHRQIEVGRFWSEIRARGFATQSVIAENGRSSGIGLVFLD